MSQKSTRQHPLLHFLPWILFAIALSFLISLLFTVKENVFFSGDGGLKFLMIQQIAKGGSITSLHLNAPSWVNSIWSQGFYPFKIPFVYDAAQGKIVSFPPSFQWLNAYTYKWFGFKGLYIIPFISVTALWLWFIILMQRVGVKPVIISVCFFALAFCSPLTVYGAMYWEHTLGIALLFSAIVFLIHKPMSTMYGALLGLMTGLSVWFRPEMLLLCLMFIIAIIVNNRKQKDRKNTIFIICTIVSIVAFFIFNAIHYQSFLGAHSYQLSDPAGIRFYIQTKLVFLTHLNARQLIYFPTIMFICVVLWNMFINKFLLPSLVNQLTIIIVAFSLIAPFAFPNAGGKQWGARYLLPVIPIVIVTLCFFLHSIDAKKVNKWLWVVALLLMIYSSYVNSYLAHKTLLNDYANRVKPGFDFLINDSIDVVVVQNQFIAQEFAAVFESKKVFLAEDKESFDRLQQLLKSNGVSKIIYVTHNAGFEMMNDKHALRRIGDYYFGSLNL